MTVATVSTASAMPSVWARLRHQYRFHQKRFWRDPAGLFYAIGFPLIFLVNFLGVLGGNDETAHIAGHTVLSKFYYVRASSR